MAQRRTKSQKNKANLTRSAKLTYSLDDLDLKVGSTAKPKKAANLVSKQQTEDMFGYSTDLIKKDLYKTIVVTLIVTAILAFFALGGERLIFG